MSLSGRGQTRYRPPSPHSGTVPSARRALSWEVYRSPPTREAVRVMSNPFEDPDADYVVLVNDEEQYSLWPASSAVPTGWSQVYGADRRPACLEFVERVWTDLRPKSVRRAAGLSRN
jgi:MbtH protein